MQQYKFFLCDKPQYEQIDRFDNIYMYILHASAEKVSLTTFCLHNFHFHH